MQKKHAQERIEQLRKTELGAKVLQNLDEEVSCHIMGWSRLVCMKYNQNTANTRIYIDKSTINFTNGKHSMECKQNKDV
jgi:hypothetical protein